MVGRPVSLVTLTQSPLNFAPFAFLKRSTAEYVCNVHIYLFMGKPSTFFSSIILAFQRGVG